MSRYWSDIVHRLTPYVPGEQPRVGRLIKLNTNECPYGPSPQVIAAIQAEINDDLRLYPDPEADRLRVAIADYFNKTEQTKLNTDNVFVGNGSDEVLAHTFHGLLRHSAPVLFPDISYSFYPVYCQLYDIAFQRIPLRDDFSIAVADYGQTNGGIVIANPNAPTGMLTKLDHIRTLLNGNRDSVVVIDEAYIDFGGATAAGLIAHHDNLLVVQTLSKSRSLAGLRVGFALGHPDLIAALNRIKNSFNSYPLGRMVISGAVAAMADTDYFASIQQKVIQSRQQLSQALEALGFRVLPSAANFIFLEHADKEAATIARELRQHNVLVRHFDSPRISNFLRISIGTDTQCQALVAALQKILAG